MVNFKTAANQARQLINSWVRNQTNGKVKEHFEMYFFLTDVFEQLLGSVRSGLPRRRVMHALG